MNTAIDKADHEKSPKLITIYVNTIAHEVEKAEISFDDVLQLAFPSPPPGSDGFTVLYQRGHGNKDGSLVEGETVKVKDGMIFDVTPTHLS
ncbi:MAG: multiubiquitin domain-containing protein [Actinobacteria bacterium]|nr:multiubiquitin domain-containing protein [Actinomycetota bacterium]